MPLLLFLCIPSVLVYSCPEESAVRLKMTYSSSKASVVAAAAEAGVTFDHMVSRFFNRAGRGRRLSSFRFETPQSDVSR